MGVSLAGKFSASFQSVPFITGNQASCPVGHVPCGTAYAAMFGLAEMGACSHCTKCKQSDHGLLNKDKNSNFKCNNITLQAKNSCS